MATESLYVNGNGTITSGWRAEGGDYTRIDEVGANDGDTTTLYTPTQNDEATWAMEDPTFDVGATINSVTVHAVIKRIDPPTNAFQIGVYISSTAYYSADKDTSTNGSYEDISESWATNPNTGVAWTKSDITSLQTAIKKTGAGNAYRLTQMFIVVDYTIGTTTSTTTTTTSSSTSSSTTTTSSSSSSSSSSSTTTTSTSSSTSSSSTTTTLDSCSLDKCTGGTASARDDAGSPVGEKAASAFDDNSSTKWLQFKTGGTPFWIQYDFGSGVAWNIGKYSITTANDAPERDPKTWTIRASNTGAFSGEEVVLDTITDGGLSDTRGVKSTFYCDSPSGTAYRYIRLEITDLKNLAAANSTQIAEIEFMDCPGGTTTSTTTSTTTTSSSTSSSTSTTTTSSSTSSSSSTTTTSTSTSTSTTTTSSSTSSSTTTTSTSSSSSTSTTTTSTSSSTTTTSSSTSTSNTTTSTSSSSSSSSSTSSSTSTTTTFPFIFGVDLDIAEGFSVQGTEMGELSVEVGDIDTIDVQGSWEN